MKKLTLYILFFWISLPVTSQAMFKKITDSFSNIRFFNNQNLHTSTTSQGIFNRWWKKPNNTSVETKKQFTQPENQLEQLDKSFRKIKYDIKNELWSEYKVSSKDFDTILKHIDNIKPEDINKPLDSFGETFLNKCIYETSQFPKADAEKIIKKMLEKGAKIDNPQAFYSPLWLAVLQGNSEAYNVLLDRSPETHLYNRYKGETLKLPHVIAFGLKRLKTMEDHYSSELQKIKNGERLGYTYRNNWGYEPYHKAVPYNLRCTTWYKNKFQKIQNLTKYDFDLSNEPLINSFLEERCRPFREHARGKVHEENFLIKKYWD